jgi:hypothetical protein
LQDLFEENSKNFLGVKNASAILAKVPIFAKYPFVN